MSGNLAGGIQVQTQPCAKTKRSELLKVLDPMQNTDSSLAGSSGNMNMILMHQILAIILVEISYFRNWPFFYSSKFSYDSLNLAIAFVLSRLS